MGPPAGQRAANGRRPLWLRKIVMMLRRLFLVLPTVFGVLTLVFFFIHLLPGDPVEVMLGEAASSADRSHLRTELGLDRPLAEQYLEFLAHAAAGDLGRSLRGGDAVAAIVLRRLPATVALAARAPRAAPSARPSCVTRFAARCFRPRRSSASSSAASSAARSSPRRSSLGRESAGSRSRRSRVAIIRSCRGACW